MDVLRVSSGSNPNAVAGAIASIIKKGEVAEMQAIGAAAVNQAVKAIAIARGFVATSGQDLIAIPAFVDVVIDDQKKTAIRFIIKTI